MIEPLRTWKGRRVRAEGGPETAENKVPQGPLRPGSLFFVPSPLDGWGLDVLLERLGPDGALVLFEKDDELFRACESGFRSYLGPLSADPRLYWLAEDTEAAVVDLFRRLPLGRLRRCEFLPLNGAWTAQAPRYREVFSRIDQGLSRWWANRMTEIHLGPLWVKNFLDNLGAGHPQAQRWPHWGEDTVLVCGAGVSLESALPWAREHRSRLRLVAADTALPVLGAWGLVPDAVVCVEAQHANLRDFSGWSGSDVQLFADLTSFPPGTRVFSRPPLWFISEFSDLELWSRWPWPDVPRLPPLGSVGVAAAWVSWRLTQGPVIFAGLDFSYPPGKSHARGAPAIQGLAATTNRLHPMEQPGSWRRPGVTAGAAVSAGWLTTPVMAGYAGVLGDQSKPHADRTFVWRSEGLPLGLSPWPAHRVPEYRAGATSAPSEDRGRVGVDAWINEERRTWSTILDELEALNRKPDEPTWVSLEAHLRRCDYLTFCFPDPGFRRESDWLIRAQAQVRWALSRLRRT